MPVTMDDMPDYSALPPKVRKSMEERWQSIVEEDAANRQNGLSIFKGERFSDPAKKRYPNMPDE